MKRPLPFKLFLESESSVRIFCDLDGVLVDFDRGFTDLSENTKKLSPGEYEEEHGKNSIWPLIDRRGSEYWSDLYWKGDGRELWDYLEEYKPTILSSPSRSRNSIIGKTKWVNLNLRIKEEPVTKVSDYDGTNRLILMQQKHLFAKSATDILIDDTRAKIDKWTEAGGTGILHNDATDTIKVLEQILERLRGDSQS
jgi:FMN phosphatase YigB (HAD superfamily)